MFLIYPYWNVNLDVDDTEEMVGLVSNLSILECKYREAFRRAISVSRF